MSNGSYGVILIVTIMVILLSIALLVKWLRRGRETKRQAACNDAQMLFLQGLHRRMEHVPKKLATIEEDTKRIQEDLDTLRSSSVQYNSEFETTISRIESILVDLSGQTGVGRTSDISTASDTAHTNEANPVQVQSLGYSDLSTQATQPQLPPKQKLALSERIHARETLPIAPGPDKDIVSLKRQLSDLQSQYSRKVIEFEAFKKDWEARESKLNGELQIKNQEMKQVAESLVQEQRLVAEKAEELSKLRKNIEADRELDSKLRQAKARAADLQRKLDSKDEELMHKYDELAKARGKHAEDEQQIHARGEEIRRLREQVQHQGRGGFVNKSTGQSISIPVQQTGPETIGGNIGIKEVEIGLVSVPSENMDSRPARSSSKFEWADYDEETDPRSPESLKAEQARLNPRAATFKPDGSATVDVKVMEDYHAQEAGPTGISVVAAQPDQVSSKKMFTQKHDPRRSGSPMDLGKAMGGRPESVQAQPATPSPSPEPLPGKATNMRGLGGSIHRPRSPGTDSARR